MSKAIWRAVCTEWLCCQDPAMLHPKYPHEDGVGGWVWGAGWGCTHNTQGTRTIDLCKANVAPCLFPSTDHSSTLQQGAITMEHLGPKTAQEAPGKVLLPWLCWKDMVRNLGSLKRRSVPHVEWKSLHCCSECQSALERCLPCWQTLRLCHTTSSSPEASEKVGIASFFAGSFSFYNYREYL